jgi:MarC family membrane protein
MRQTFLSTTLLLILITDPLGNVPPLLALLQGVPPARRRHIILRECAIALLVLLVFLVGGRPLLHLLRLTEETLRIAGGVILFLIALNMIFPGSGARLREPGDAGEPFIVPIAVPLVAGPAAIVTAMLLSGADPDRMAAWVGAIAIAIATSAAVFLAADHLRRVLHPQVIVAGERLMGLVLTAVAIDMLLGGLVSYCRSHGF